MPFCIARGIYDNLKTVVTTVMMEKDRAFNRQFQSLASHYLFEPVAYTPATGWEKGQVENPAGLVRKRFFALRHTFADLAELNQWLNNQFLAYAASHKHPETPLLSVADAFKEERRHLLTVTMSLDGYLQSTACIRLKRKHLFVICHRIQILKHGLESVWLENQ